MEDGDREKERMRRKGDENKGEISDKRTVFPASLIPLTTGVR